MVNKWEKNERAQNLKRWKNEQQEEEVQHNLQNKTGVQIPTYNMGTGKCRQIITETYIL